MRKNGVVVSESFALKFDKARRRHDRAPAARAFPITGIYRDYSNDRGVVVMDRPLFIRTFDDDAINTIVVFLKPGVTVEHARRELEKRFGPKYGAFVVTNGEIKAEVMRIFDQTFMITYALLGVAIVVAVLGIVNTLAALILERTRELALLRIGGLSTRRAAHDDRPRVDAPRRRLDRGRTGHGLRAVVDPDLRDQQTVVRLDDRLPHARRADRRLAGGDASRLRAGGTRARAPGARIDIATAIKTE